MEEVITRRPSLQPWPCLLIRGLRPRPRSTPFDNTSSRTEEASLLGQDVGSGRGPRLQAVGACLRRARPPYLSHLAQPVCLDLSPCRTTEVGDGYRAGGTLPACRGVGDDGRRKERGLSDDRRDDRLN